MELTPGQQAAVERTGQDVCVIAGPGSGKTSVLIARFAWLVRERDINPEKILAITFTDKAATEIKNRLVREFAAEEKYRTLIERAPVSTIHGLCARLLRENWVLAGLAPDFAVLDDAWSWQMRRESAEAALDELYRAQPHTMRQLLEALDISTQENGRQPDLVESLLDVYETMRSAGVALESIADQPLASESHSRGVGLLRRVVSESLAGATPKQQLEHESFKAWARRFLSLPQSPVTREHLALVADFSTNAGRLKMGSFARATAKELKEDLLKAIAAEFIAEFHRPLRTLLVAALTRVDADYRARKRGQGALDFNDLEEIALRLLEGNDDLRTALAASFDAILMDELQDTNHLQWRLLDQLRRPDRFFAVGDINQSIYGFRHADPGLFDGYRTSLLRRDLAVDDLRENHRSRADILRAVEQMVGGQTGIEHRALIAAKSFPPKEEPSLEVITGSGDKAAENEASWIARRIRELTGALPIGKDTHPAQYSDVAILVRTLGCLGPIERQLERFAIPYLVSSGRTFFEGREVRDLLLFLSVLANPLDQVALAGVYRSPLVGLSDEAVAQTVFETAGFQMSEDDAARLSRFNFLLARLRPIAGQLSPDRLLLSILEESNYEQGLTESARANIEKFLTLLRDRHAQAPKALPQLLDDLEALRESETEADAPPGEAGNVVRILSIHGAKGLEFPIVFLPALQRGADRRRPVLSYTNEDGLGARWRDPVTHSGQPDPAHLAATAKACEREEAEEHRLLYVAMTRAQEHLVLSYAESSRPASKWWKLIEHLRVPALRIVATAAANPEEVASPPIAVPDERFVERPPTPDQYDANASVTSIALFHACPRKYYLSRYLGFEAERKQGAVDGEDLPAAELGTQVHAILAGTLSGNEDAAAITLANRFTASELGRRSRRASRAEREFDFVFALEDVVLRGQIDLWFREGGEVILVDYKTDRNDPPVEYGLQLRIYALALERLLDRRIDRAYLYLLRSDRALEIDLSDRAMEEAVGSVREFREAQSTLHFPLRPGEQCKRCEFYRGMCPAGKQLVFAGFSNPGGPFQRPDK